MVVKAVGGGTSAVAASSHAACARFRGTDPLITGLSRRALAEDLGLRGQFGTITAARWARAMTFERMVFAEENARQIATTTLGALGLERPTGVAIVDAHVNADSTAELLEAAHDRAKRSGTATLIYQLAVPFVGFEGESATDVKPDFALVAANPGDADRTWLIAGDVKDYERVRSRIDDSRLLKGFLQVAIAAESLDAWSLLPVGMHVHSHGVLAVPRNSFLQPEARVELLEDHRAEVRMRINERRMEAGAIELAPDSPVEEFVSHLVATFDPVDCQSCTLFGFCRQQLRQSNDPFDLLVEIGIPVFGRVDFQWPTENDELSRALPQSTRARVRASVDGVAQSTGQSRVDPVGFPGTINVVIAKSDSTTLGVYGIGVQRFGSDGPGEWQVTVFDAPQSDDARRGIVRAIGVELVAAMKDRRVNNSNSDAGPEPVHLVVPDSKTADILTSIADHLAGAELSRLRWETDRVMGRPTLTFNGDPAQVPRKLTEPERTGVSFLLEEDRARALTLRTPVVVLQRVLSEQMVAGGPEVNEMRLDYLVEWTRDGDVGRERHRTISDAIESETHTPGALLSTVRANDIHEAFVGKKHGGARPADPVHYESLVRDELSYKCAVVDSAITALAQRPMSRLAGAYRAIEGDAQGVWRRRVLLHASDLVRFGRVARWWRNALVQTIETDGRCRAQLSALTNPTYAIDAATDAGTREVSMARVVATDPLTIQIDSRRFDATTRVVLMHVDGSPCVESGLDATLLKGSVKVSDLSIGPLRSTSLPKQFEWFPDVQPVLTVGDELVVADFSWFSNNKGNRSLNVDRPQSDTTVSPKPTCESDSFEQDPAGHKYCCRPHEDIEAEWSNTLADRRGRGELNPQTWPPVVDTDGFEITGVGARIDDPNDEPAVAPPAHITTDDVD